MCILIEAVMRHGVTIRALTFLCKVTEYSYINAHSTDGYVDYSFPPEQYQAPRSQFEHTTSTMATAPTMDPNTNTRTKY